MCQESLQRDDRLIDRIANFAHLARRENHGVRRNVAMTGEIDAESGQCVEDSFGVGVPGFRIDHGLEVEKRKRRYSTVPLRGSAAANELKTLTISYVSEPLAKK